MTTEDPASSRETPYELSHPGFTETRVRQVWVMAVITALALALVATFLDAHPYRQLQSSTGDVALRISLILSLLLACTYFRECTLALTQANRWLHAALTHEQSEARSRRTELARMRQLSDILMSRQDLESALDTALQMATEVIGADTASIMLLDESGEHLTIAAAAGLPEQVVSETRIGIGDGLAGLVAKEGETIVLDSDNLDDRLRPLAQRTQQVQSAIITPIKLDGQVRGVINVTNRRDGSKYGDYHVGIVTSLAQQASMVIQKIELNQRLDRHVSEMADALELVGKANKSRSRGSKADKNHLRMAA